MFKKMILKEEISQIKKFWKQMLIFEITKNKHAPTPKGSRPYFDSSAPYIP